MELYIITIFTVFNTVFIILNVSLIIYYKRWAVKKDKEYKQTILNITTGTDLIINSLKDTKESLGTFTRDLKNYYETK